MKKIDKKEEQVEVLENNNEEIELLNKQIADLEEKVKFFQAELINYRRRKDDETTNKLKFANQDLILELIPISDNFERAIKLDDQNLEDELSKFLSGFKLIYSHLNDILKKYGVEEIPTVGEIFNPNLHEALLAVNDPTKEDDVIVECLLKGYTLKDKVIRHAKVTVNKL